MRDRRTATPRVAVRRPDLVDCDNHGPRLNQRAAGPERHSAHPATHPSGPGRRPQRDTSSTRLADSGRPARGASTHVSQARDCSRRKAAGHVCQAVSLVRRRDAICAGSRGGPLGLAARPGPPATSRRRCMCPQVDAVTPPRTSGTYSLREASFPLRVPKGCDLGRSTGAGAVRVRFRDLAFWVGTRAGVNTRNDLDDPRVTAVPIVPMAVLVAVQSEEVGCFHPGTAADLVDDSDGVAGIGMSEDRIAARGTEGGGHGVADCVLTFALRGVGDEATGLAGPPDGRLRGRCGRGSTGSAPRARQCSWFP